MDRNIKRVTELSRRLGFDFACINKAEIIALIEAELALPQKGSSEYLRILCGYLYCIGDPSDAELIKRVKYSDGMDLGCMIDGEWIESLLCGGIESKHCRSRDRLIEDFVNYYQGMLEDYPAIGFRYAQRSDVPLILRFIKGLAEYERLADQVVATEELLEHWLFDKQKAEVIFALDGTKEVGFALFFHNFSTFLGRAGIYLEDLFVLPEHRGRGFGKALLRRLAQLAVERGCGRLEWCCLDWNKPSIDFYLPLGAQPMEDWTIYRLAGDILAEFVADETE